jgi:hypothetical protein
VVADDGALFPRSQALIAPSNSYVGAALVMTRARCAVFYGELPLLDPNFRAAHGVGDAVVDTADHFFFSRDGSTGRASQTSRAGGSAVDRADGHTLRVGVLEHPPPAPAPTIIEHDRE